MSTSPSNHKTRVRNFGYTPSAAFGSAGMLLLDPTNYAINNGNGASTSTTIGANTLQTLLASNNVVIATGAGTGTGTITVSSNVAWNTANSLSLLAHGNIAVNASLLNSGSGAVNLVAGWDGTTGAPGATGANSGASFNLATFLATPSSYGNTANGGDITIGPTNAAIGVGSASGGTNLLANSVTITGGSNSNRASQVGFRGTTASGDISVVAKSSVTLNAGSAQAQIGHGGSGNGSTFSGKITVTAGGAISLTGTNLTSTYALIGHSDSPGESGAQASNDNVSGNIEIKAGSNLTLATAAIGHIADAGGTYGSGNTFIGVGQGATNVGTLTADSGSAFRSAATGQLRFYMPDRASNSIAAGTPLNGVAAVISNPLPNEQGYAFFGQGPYSITTVGTNYAYYFNKINLYVTADSGQSKIYNNGVNPAYTYTTTGLVNSDTTATVLSGSLDRIAGENVGFYAINQGTLLSTTNKYQLNFTGANFQILARALTVMPDGGQSKVYGATNPTYTFTTANLVSGDTVTGSLGRATGENVSTYAYNLGSVSAGSNYFPVLVVVVGSNDTFAITPATLTYLANAASRLYGEANPAFSGTVTGFVNGETQGTATTGSLLFSSAATATSNVGSYAINGSGLSANNGNYVFAQAAGNATALTINPATLTYLANAASRLYGEANPAFSGTVTGFVNGETQGTATTGSLLFSSAATATSNVGSYAINGSGLSANNGNYVFAQAAGNATALTINPASLTITANNRSKTYGNTLTLGSTAFTPVGLKNGETIGGVTLTSGGAVATAPVSGSPYAIIPSNATGGTFSSGNYTISYVNGNLTVNRAILVITALPQSKVYGDSFTFNGVPGSAGADVLVIGLRNGETIGNVALNSAATSLTANAGLHGITASNPTGGTFNLNNYSPTFVPSLFLVTRAPLTITANNQSKTYGDAFTFSGSEFTPTGLKNGETIGSVTLVSAATSATAGVAGSPYGITASNPVGGTFNINNYNVSFAGGLFTVNKAPLTIVAHSASKSFGAEYIFDGTTGFTAIGLKNGETIGSVSLGSLGAPTLAPVGVYPIFASSPAGGTFNLSNYQATFVPGALYVGVSPGNLTHDQFERARWYFQTISTFFGGNVGAINWGAAAVEEEKRMAGTNSYELFGGQQ